MLIEGRYIHPRLFQTMEFRIDGNRAFIARYTSIGFWQVENLDGQVLVKAEAREPLIQWPLGSELLQEIGPNLPVVELKYANFLKVQFDVSPDPVKISYARTSQLVSSLQMQLRFSYKCVTAELPAYPSEKISTPLLVAVLYFTKMRRRQSTVAHLPFLGYFLK